MSAAVKIACLVEGHGECEAVPRLLHRIVRAIDSTLALVVNPVLRVPASRLIKPGEIERHVELAARKIGGQGGIFILLDSDDGCPAEDGPQLLRRARAARDDLPVTVVFAQREFEAWFLAAAESLRGFRGLPRDLTAPSDPEAIRGAKEWLEQRLPRHQCYSETLDQPAFTSRFDLDTARRADSFDKCCREVERMIACLKRTPAP